MIGLQNGAEEVWSTFAFVAEEDTETEARIERGRLIWRRAVFELFFRAKEQGRRIKP